MPDQKPPPPHILIDAHQDKVHGDTDKKRVVKPGRKKPQKN